MTLHKKPESSVTRPGCGTRVFRAAALVPAFVILLLAAQAFAAQGDMYRYYGKDGATYTDDPQMIPPEYRDSVTVLKAPALPEGVTPLTAEEKAREEADKKKKAYDARDAQRQRTAESYKRLMEQKEKAVKDEALEKARKAYDDEKAWIAKEEEALKRELAELEDLKAQAAGLAKRKRNPRKGRQYKTIEEEVAQASKHYEAHKTVVDARKKAFESRKRP